MIYDAKYVSMPKGEKQSKLYNRSFMFFLQPRGKKDEYRLGAAFGFGNISAMAFSKNFELKTGKSCTVSMHFTALGKVIFYLNGKQLNTATVPSGVLTPGKVNPVLGNRVGSNYAALGGRIKKLVIKKMPFNPVNIVPEQTKRRVFERGEKNCKIYMNLQNLSAGNLDNVILKIYSSSQLIKTRTIPRLAANSSLLLTRKIDSTLLPGDYQYRIEISQNGKQLAEAVADYTIVPSYGDFMPVILWGTLYKPSKLREYGFTHQILHFFPPHGKFNAQSLKRIIPELDESLKNNLYSVGSLHAHYRFLRHNRHLRTDRNNKPYPRKNLEASHPAVRKEFAAAAIDTASYIADHPAFDGCLINSEIRDASLPSFGSGVEPAAFKKFAGYSIPATISGKSPQPYQSNRNFPWDRVISGKTPELVFLRWFWLQGDGWNPLQTLLSQSLHKTLQGVEHKKRFFTFYDPVTRTPPLWGSGGDVDMISQWTYTYPDPIRIGQTTDEVIAMSHGNPRQKIASMTQAIWYRSQTAPPNKKVKNPPAWLQEEPKANFISIAPDSLREALWIKISRRLDAIMYHGVGSLIERTDHWGYRFTNTQSREVLKELANNVIQPLGPVLKRIPERPLEVAILESFPGSLYAPKHFPMGWGKGWVADLHLALQWVHCQPGIIYDEHLLHNRHIDQLKVLFVPGLEVVTEEVLQKLNELRLRGVIIVGDEFTTPALMTDYRLQSIARQNNKPLETKVQLQKLGKEIVQVLQDRLPRRVTADNQDLIVRSRGCDRADYIFAVNDKRTFGDYVGQWRLVPEKGEPNSGIVTVHHPAAAAYDLVKHQPVVLKKQDRKCSFQVDLAPGSGKLILLLDRAINSIDLNMPERIKQGEKYTIKLQISDKNRQVIAACLPVEVTLTAANSVKLPGSGYYAAVNGSLIINEIMAPNAPAGKAKISVRCLASGKIAEKSFIIE